MPSAPKLPPLPRATGRPRLVGLLGGSFNPAHEGHRYISLEARRRLGLDEIWWMVSPQNPLKAKAGMAPLAERLEDARQVAGRAPIRVTDIELRMGTRFTADTLHRLTALPGLRFVWLIGADNLIQLPRWKRWRDVLRACPVAVFERHPYAYPALAGAVASAFGTARVPDATTHRLALADPPAWAFLRLRPHPASATRIRAAEEGRSSTRRRARSSTS